MSIFDILSGHGAALILIALGIELLVGWPASVFAIIRHPVVWIGALISLLEGRLNQAPITLQQRINNGAITTITVVVVSIAVASTLCLIIPNNLAGYFVEAVVASSLLAGRSLYTHVTDVAKPLTGGDLPNARTALAKIVGRDTKQLEENGIAGAALETLAENASDGVIAPIFWGILFGLPGLAAYKAINTLDSMIGHKTERYKFFGLFAARLDDVANWVPARLTAMLFWCCANLRPSNSQVQQSFNAISKEATRHRSPNAGWPESTMAFALGVRLSGPRQYETGFSNEPWLNEAGNSPTAKDLQKGLRLYSYTLALTAMVLLVFVLLRILYLG